MGRKRSELICPKCGKQGILRIKKTRGNNEYGNARWNEYRYFQHYDSITRKNKSCYVENKLNKTTNDISFAINDLLRNISIVIEKIEKTNVTYEDGQKITSLLKKGLKEIVLFIGSWHLYVKLNTTKENKTEKEIRFLQLYKKWLDDFPINSEKFEKINDLFKRRREIDFDDPDIQNLIIENVGGYFFYHDLFPNFNKAVEFWFEKYELHKRLEKRKLLNEKLSESAFGSNKYPGTMRY